MIFLKALWGLFARGLSGNALAPVGLAAAILLILGWSVWSNKRAKEKDARAALIQSAKENRLLRDKAASKAEGLSQFKKEIGAPSSVAPAPSEAEAPSPEDKAPALPPVSDEEKEKLRDALFLKFQGGF